MSQRKTQAIELRKKMMDDAADAKRCIIAKVRVAPYCGVYSARGTDAFRLAIFAGRSSAIGRY
jgi:hypothetical protein